VVWTIRKGTIGLRWKCPERRQLRPRAHWCLSSPTCSVVLDPVFNIVRTAAIRCDRGRSRLGDYFLFTARAGAQAETEKKMPKKRAKAVSLPVVEPNATGVNIGATQIFVAYLPIETLSLFVASTHSR